MGANLSYATVDLSGRVVIVTGSNTGVGYEAAKAMASMGAKVVMACRSQDRAEQAIERMKGELPEATLDLEFAKLDLSSLKSTASFADSFLSKHDKLNILCCNAGIFSSTFRLTEDGMESMFQTNHLGHFLLMTRLLPLLKTSSPDPRIVSVSSAAHKSGVFDLAPTNDPASFSRFRSYGTSKLLQVMLTGALQRRLECSGVTVSSLHPGAVKTEIARDSTTGRALYTAANAIGALRGPVEGAATTIYACVNPELQGQQHLYFDSCKPAEVSQTASDAEKQEQLFEHSVGLLKELISEDGAQALGIHLTNVKTPEFGLPLPPPEATPTAAAATATATATAATAGDDTPSAEPARTAADAEKPAETEEKPAEEKPAEEKPAEENPAEEKPAEEAAAVHVEEPCSTDTAAGSAGAGTEVAEGNAADEPAVASESNSAEGKGSKE